MGTTKIWQESEATSFLLNLNPYVQCKLVKLLLGSKGLLLTSRIA